MKKNKHSQAILLLTLFCAAAFAQTPIDTNSAEAYYSLEKSKSADRIKDFIDSVQTKGAKINVDSISKLKGAELKDYIKKARKRPLHIQVDTIIIDEKKELDERTAWFNPSLNIIVLNYYLIDSAYWAYLQERKTLKFIEIGEREASNKKLDKKFEHEFKHASDYRNFQALSLNPEQILQYSIHLEITASIAELLHTRMRFLKYKEPPFVLSREELEKKASKRNEVLYWYPSKWSNPFSEDFDFRSTRGDRIYNSYLSEHKNLSETPDDYESLVILFAALSEMKFTFGRYRPQFIKHIEFGLEKDVVDKEFDEITKGKNSRLPSFDEQIQKMYIFKIDGKDFDLLAAVGSTGKLGLMKVIKDFTEDETILAEYNRIIKEKSKLIDFRVKLQNYYLGLEDSKISTWDVMLVPTTNP